MRLNERLTALEQRKATPEHGIVVVQNGEAVHDAIKRMKLSKDRLNKGILLVPAKEQ